MRATTMAIGMTWIALGCAGSATPPALELWTEPAPNGREIAALRGLEGEGALPSEPRTRLRLAPSRQGFAVELSY